MLNHFCEFQKETVVKTSVGGKNAHMCGPVEIGEWGWRHEDKSFAVDLGDNVLQVRLVISDLENKEDYYEVFDKVVGTLSF